MSKEGRATRESFDKSARGPSYQSVGSGESTGADLRKLAVLARHAYEQKRTRHCLALTKALLLFDPENPEARLIQSSIRSDVQRDLKNARALTENVHDLPERSRQAAESLLSSILTFDPDNEEAKTLLSRITSPPSEAETKLSLKAAPATEQSTAFSPTGERTTEAGLASTPLMSSHVEPEPMIVTSPEPREIVWTPPRPSDWPGLGQESMPDMTEPLKTSSPPIASGGVDWSAEDAPLRLVHSVETRGFPNSPALPDWSEEHARPHVMPAMETFEEGFAAGTSTLRRFAIPIGLAILLGVAVAVIMLTRLGSTTLDATSTETAPLGTASRSGVPASTGSTALPAFASDPDDVFFADNQIVDPPLSSIAQTPVAPPVQPLEPTEASKSGEALAPPPVAPAPTGKLALSSPTSAEIYRNGEYLGSTPISLDLPPGNHTLEYRHRDLTNFVTHVVRSNETTRSMVTFDLSMNINARPWAQVFLEGASRRALGQTPLSDVRVPIGSTLVFRHPNFPEKSYRVTGMDTAIQITFP
jgi:hypothetical protein